MHLLKISVDKKAYALRAEVSETLPTMDLCTEDKIAGIVPALRSKTDAYRAAAAYTLLRYRRFYNAQGRTCEVLAKNPKSDNNKGMILQINVREIEKKINYSEEICTISSPDAHTMPEMIRESAASDYAQLCEDLDVSLLVEQGQARLYDGDLRKIIDRLLEPYTVGLWTGLSLVLDDTGLEYVKRLQRCLNSVLCAGTVTLLTLALDMSHANRQALARELADEFNAQLANIIERCAYTAPNVDSIMSAYEMVSGKISQAASLLAIDIPCSDAQLQAETALMALA